MGAVPLRAPRLHREGVEVPVATAPAKVNLFLGVGDVRPDGYHAVSTVLHALDLCDTITAESADHFTFFCDPEPCPSASNLAVRAARELSRALARPLDVSLSLVKRVPHGRGLGGGSSDAAACLALLCHRWDVDTHAPEVLAVAASLGADVPFFLTRTGSALMGGRGDEFVRELPGLSGVPVVVAAPNDPVPTAAAYAAFRTAPRPAGAPDRIVLALESGDVAALATALDNNLEWASCAVVTAVADALSWLREEPGVLGAAVAGSGSAVFGVCEDADSAREAAAAAGERGWYGQATALRASGVTIEGGGGGS